RPHRASADVGSGAARHGYRSLAGWRCFQLGSVTHRWQGNYPGRPERTRRLAIQIWSLLGKAIDSDTGAVQVKA
ncbi:MAG: hypothetical protein QOF33_4643, partial [Thermomicrobiales bacterium]|nr:hypothetical protein [Thermomicrobiales bacterium]